MKLPNGFGSVHKLPGNRRKPWRARKTVGWDTDYEKGTCKQKYATIGYYPTQAEALQALADYNANPYDISTNQITFEEIYEKWSEEHFQMIVPSARRTWKSAFSYCTPLYHMRMKDIRAEHLEQTIRSAAVGDNTKIRMKSLFNLMYKYCLKHEIVEKNYPALCDSIKKPKPKIIRTPFSTNEIQKLWDNIQFPFVDMVLIGIYSGFRPQELAVLKTVNIDFENNIIKGGLKTDAGKNRLVPIHPAVLDLVYNNYNKALSLNSEYLFNDEKGQQGTWLTYDKYRGRWNKIMEKLALQHRPHDTRHTFITKAKSCNVDEYILKLIVGHEVSDITEKVYTHRTVEDLQKEIVKIN